MPDKNNRVLRLWDRVIIHTSEPEHKQYDLLEGEIVGLRPFNGGLEAEVRFDVPQLGAHLFEGRELIIID